VPFAGYKDFADCVAKNQDKGDPEAYCAVIQRQVEKEAYRHFDFQRIYNEFHNVFPQEEAESLYYDWLNAMSLDESREYGQARESYLWNRDALRFVKEDSANKYYEVEIGFPTKSMNGNVYNKRDLVAASLTLKGKHPSLNHKDQYWFSPKNPRNRWGNIEIVDGRFHEGISKALIAVPKNMICPVCNGKKMTELIDSRKIVNVSLEGDCMGGICPTTGECEGFYFTDPPFTFLTTDVLPGIPMTRIKPLESYMPSQSSTYRGKITENKEKNRILKIKPKIIEDAPTGTNEPQTKVDTKTFGNQTRGTFGTPITSDNKVDTQEDLAQTVVGGSIPDNYNMRSGTAESRRREQNEPEFADLDQPYAPMDGPADDTSQPKPEDIRTGPTQTQPPESDTDQPPEAPTTLPAQEKPEKEVGEEPPKATVAVKVGDAPVEQADEEPCPDGYHRNEEGECVPDEPLDEKVRRFKAEDKARSLNEQVTLWESRYSKLSGLYTKLRGKAETLEKALKRQESRADEAIRQLRNQEVKTSEWYNKYGKEVALREEYKSQNEALHQTNKRLSEKYNDAMKTNLELSMKVTSANEDYLEKAKENELLKEKLNKTRVLAKKTLKIKV